MTLTRTANTRTANTPALKTRKIKKTVLGAAVLAFAFLPQARPAAAAPAASAAGGQVFGSVDILKVQQGSTRQAKYSADLRALEDRLDAAFKTQATNIMLSSADQNQLGTLLTNPRPTDAERAQITALETKASQAADQLVALQQKKDPTPADTAQLGTLTDMNNNGTKTVQDIGAGYQAQIKKLADDDGAAFTLIVKEAIAAAARERGLTMVFTSDVAVYTTNDITEDVIKRVNK